MTDLRKILHCAQKAALAAGRIHRDFRKRPVAVTEKSVTFNLVTEADVAAEKAVAQVIRKHFPDHNILGEEGHYEKTDSPWLWIVDPIDGTTNFTRGFPHFSVSIAAYRDGQAQAGVVYNPVLKEMFYASRGGGAFLNGRPLKTSQARELNQALLITGFYYDRDRALDLTLQNIGKLKRLGILGIRRLGSAALDLCWVAAGRADGFFEIGLNAWDFAAGVLILQEAGGIVTGLDGLPLRPEKSYVIGAGPHLHEKLLSVLKETGV